MTQYGQPGGLKKPGEWRRSERAFFRAGVPSRLNVTCTRPGERSVRCSPLGLINCCSRIETLSMLLFHDTRYKYVCPLSYINLVALRIPRRLNLLSPSRRHSFVFDRNRSYIIISLLIDPLLLELYFETNSFNCWIIWSTKREGDGKIENKIKSCVKRV